MTTIDERDAEIGRLRKRLSDSAAEIGELRGELLALRHEALSAQPIAMQLAGLVIQVARECPEVYVRRCALQILERLCPWATEDLDPLVLERLRGRL